MKAIFCRRFPGDLARKFRAYCNARGISIFTKMRELLEKTIENGKDFQYDEDDGESSPNEVFSLLVQNIPKSLHDKFKAWCTLHNISMKRKIILLMQQTLNGERK